MGYITITQKVDIDIDTDDFIDEIDDDDLLKELKRRGLYDDSDSDSEIDLSTPQTARRSLGRLLSGLNEYASKEDIIDKLNKLL